MFRLMLGLALAAQVNCSQLTDREPGSVNPRADEEAAIRAVSDREFEAVATGDLDALVSVLGDAVMMPPNEAAIHGSRAFTALQREFYSQNTIQKFDHSREELVVAGDWAFERWTVSMTVAPKNEGAVVSDEVKGIHIFRKQPDGRWRLVRDIWNSDRPVPGGDTP